MTCPRCVPFLEQLAADEEIACAWCATPTGAPDTTSTGPRSVQLVRRAVRSELAVRTPRVVRASSDGVIEVGVGSLADRQRRAAAPVLRADPELDRVRVVLAELRPDFADPFDRPPAQTMAVASVRIHRAGWDYLAPPGYGQMQLGSGPAARAHLADLLAAWARARRAPIRAQGVLWWMRAEATLRSGLRGLYVEAGLALATRDERAGWDTDLGRRREGANALGGHLVREACAAWDRAARVAASIST